MDNIDLENLDDNSLLELLSVLNGMQDELEKSEGEGNE